MNYKDQIKLRLTELYSERKSIDELMEHHVSRDETEYQNLSRRRFILTNLITDLKDFDYNEN